MDTTSNLGLPLIVAAQAQKHVTHNEALRALDAIVQLSVLDKDLAAPPGTPAEGARYIVAAGATGAWSGQDGRIAALQDGAWAFYAAQEGWLAWVADEDGLYVWSGSAWTPVAGGGGLANVVEDTTPQLGGHLDANGHNIGFDDGTGLTDDAGNAQLVLNKSADAVNHIALGNAPTGTGPGLAASGPDTDIDLHLAPKGTGAVRADGQVAVVSPTYPPLRAERSTGGTSTPIGTLQLLASSSGDMVDGFATNHDFAIQDSAAVINNIGSLQFARSGSDNSGRFRVLPANAGSQTTQFEIAPGGSIYFPGAATTATAANAVLNNVSTPANELLRSTSSARYKASIEDIDERYARNILQLRPVWYRSKCPADNPAWSWFGLIAEEVAVIEPRLTSWGYPDDDYDTIEKEVEGKVVRERMLRRGARLVPDGVTYDRLPVLLLAIIKRHEVRLQAIEAKLASWR